MIALLTHIVSHFILGQEIIESQCQRTGIYAYLVLFSRVAEGELLLVVISSLLQCLLSTEPLVAAVAHEQVREDNNDCCDSE